MFQQGPSSLPTTVDHNLQDAPLHVWARIEASGLVVGTGSTESGEHKLHTKRGDCQAFNWIVYPKMFSNGTRGSCGVVSEEPVDCLVPGKTMSGLNHIREAQDNSVCELLFLCFACSF